MATLPEFLQHNQTFSVTYTEFRTQVYILPCTFSYR